MPEHTLIQPNPRVHLRAFTDVRIVLGHAGSGQMTDVTLAFGVVRAQARDAVYLPLDSATVAAAFKEAGSSAAVTHGAATDRMEYLCRSDLGRRLNETSHTRFGALRPVQPLDIVFVIADGLSVLAVHNHTMPLLCSVREPLPAGRSIGPVAIAEQSRVAPRDRIGALLGTRQVAVLIGERSGLSLSDSLGTYLTYAPRIGRSDVGRNYISNMRPTGQVYDQTATQPTYPLNSVPTLGRSDTDLKDDTPSASPGAARPAEPRNL